MAKILITAGATHEHIDPVRYITNASSGKQGIHLAHEAVKRGNNVVLILGKTHIEDVERPGLEIIHVTSADEMYKAAVNIFPSCDVAICAAAVGDYKVANIATEKIKRTGDTVILELVPNKDIAKELGAMKTAKQTLIGFALETSNGDISVAFNNAVGKIKKKNLDFIVLNITSAENPAFNVDSNQIWIINSDGGYTAYSPMVKSHIAKKILDVCL
jgi:phosphopantothenoylcysteine decarboxylase/phosphopantothenate--cysteine ligase